MDIKNKKIKSVSNFSIWVILFWFFIGENVLRCFNYWPKDNLLFEDVSMWKLLHPAGYLLAFWGIFSFKKLPQYKCYNYIYIIFLIIYIFSIFIHHRLNLFNFLPIFILPILCLQISELYSEKQIRLLKKGILSFFIAECIIAILEKVLHINFFYTGVEEDVFRSYAFLGHCLQNAHIVSILMCFILFSNIKYKYYYLLIGEISMLCFESRSCTVYWIIAFLVYLLYLGFAEHKFGKVTKIVLVIAIIAVPLANQLIEAGFGKRLLETGLGGESTDVRYEIWDLFDYVSVSDILFGLESKTLDSIRLLAGLSDTRIENFVIGYTMAYGAIITALLFLIWTFFYFKIMKYKGYSIFQILFTLSTLYILAWTNNSFMVTNCCLYLMLSICIIIFSSNKKTQNILIK